MAIVQFLATPQGMAEQVAATVYPLIKQFMSAPYTDRVLLEDAQALVEAIVAIYPHIAETKTTDLGTLRQFIVERRLIKHYPVTLCICVVSGHANLHRWLASLLVMAYPLWLGHTDESRYRPTIDLVMNQLRLLTDQADGAGLALLPPFSGGLRGVIQKMEKQRENVSPSIASHRLDDIRRLLNFYLNYRDTKKTRRKCERVILAASRGDFAIDDDGDKGLKVIDLPNSLNSMKVNPGATIWRESNAIQHIRRKKLCCISSLSNLSPSALEKLLFDIRAKRSEPAAAMILLMAAYGRSFSDLTAIFCGKHKAASFIKKDGFWHYVVKLGLTTDGSRGASKRVNMKAQQKFNLRAPDVLAQCLNTLEDSDIWHQDGAMLKADCTKLLRSQSFPLATRYTLNRIASCFRHWLKAKSAPSQVVNYLLRTQQKLEAAGYYGVVHATDIDGWFRKYWAELGLGYGADNVGNFWVGSSRVPEPARYIQYLNSLQNSIDTFSGKTLDELLKNHNASSTLIVARLDVFTGFRRVDFSYESLTLMQLKDCGFAIRDKDHYDDDSYRLQIPSRQFIETVRCYCDYLRLFQRQVAAHKPQIASHIEAVVDGKVPAFFFIDHNEIVAFTESARRHYEQLRPAFSQNAHRHLIKHLLHKSSEHPRAVDAFMGHDYCEANIFNRYSVLEKSSLESVSKATETELLALGLQPLRASE